MSTNDSKAPAPSKKGKAKEKKLKSSSSGSVKAQIERLKVVVRRLPPNLPEDVFWQSVQQWVTDETATWKVYHAGKFKTRLNKENITSRAYIAFKTEEMLATFSREYDGHLFRDKAGNESVAVVEFAPFQKVPSDKRKVDTRAGTIEKDEDYISFLESLKEVTTKPFDADTLETLVASTQPPPKPTTTPLLEALKAEKSAQKDKEAILRNHAHYKDPSTLGGLKKDEKKKAAAAAAKAAEAAAGKKGGKKAAAAAKAAGSKESKTATASANASTAGPSKQAGPSATGKPPKPPRERKPPHSAAGTATSPTTTAPPPTILSAGDPASPAVTSPTSQLPGAHTPASQAPAASPARRARPVLGIASRQFEAALSGAGVERKSRREREREKEKDGERADAVTPVHPVAPAILQRDGTQTTPKILARPVPAEGAPTDSVDAPAAAPRGAGPGRGRGRGRGRGAPRPL